MINLLPQNEKEILWKEEKKKMFLVLEILGFVFLLCSILILTSMEIYISGQAEAERIILEQEKEEFQSSEFKDCSREIKSANEVFAGLDSFYKNQVKLTNILKEVSEVIPEGIYLDNFSYQSQTSQVTISGFSRSREILIRFKNNLEQKGNFKEVYFPPACWLESTDINFNSSFKVER